MFDPVKEHRRLTIREEKEKGKSADEVLRVIIRGIDQLPGLTDATRRKMFEQWAAALDHVYGPREAGKALRKVITPMPSGPRIIT